MTVEAVTEASPPDTSVAEVARRHELNANLVFNWRRKFSMGNTPARLAAVTLEAQIVPDAAALRPPRPAPTTVSI